MKLPDFDLLDPALRAALCHLNWNRGRGDVGRITFNAKGEGYAKRYYFHRFPDSFRFSFTVKANPARVTVRALGSTRTELFQAVNRTPENRR
jgi:hypothetical protein